jgi:hypothetical protein
MTRWQIGLIVILVLLYGVVAVLRWGPVAGQCEFRHPEFCRLLKGAFRLPPHETPRPQHPE